MFLNPLSKVGANTDARCVCFAAILELLLQASAYHPSPQPRPQGLESLIHLEQLAAGEAVRLPGGLLDPRLPTQSTCECSPETLRGEALWNHPQRSLEGNVPLTKHEKGERLGLPSVPLQGGRRGSG